MYVYVYVKTGVPFSVVQLTGLIGVNLWSVSDFPGGVPGLNARLKETGGR